MELSIPSRSQKARDSLLPLSDELGDIQDDKLEELTKIVSLNTPI